MGRIVREGEIRLRWSPMSFIWAAAYKSKVDGSPCGDGYLVQETDTGVKLVVVDGAGSGVGAAEASARCLRHLAADASVSLPKLFDGAHKACQGSHGAALAIATVDPLASKMVWAAVGDIEGLLLNITDGRPSKREAIVQRGGTLGHHLPTIIPQTHRLEGGDVIIMSSDGIRHAHRDAIVTTKSAENLATDTLDTYGRESDDAMVLVVRCEDNR